MPSIEELKQRVLDAYDYEELLDLLFSYDRLTKDIVETLELEDFYEC